MRATRGTLVIAGRDLRAALSTPLAPTVIAGFLLVSGTLFVVLLAQFHDVSEAVRAKASQDPDALARLNLDESVSLQLLRFLSLVLVGLVPLLTMRAFAEERRDATMELLLTAPVTPLALVLGKFLAALALVLIPILLTGLYPLLLSSIAPPDLPLLATGYLGLALVAAAFTAIGLVASACTSSPAVAAFLAFVLIAVSVLAGVVGGGLQSNLGTLLAAMSVIVHFGSLAGGVVDTGDIVALACLVVGGLFVALRIVESQRWR